MDRRSFLQLSAAGAAALMLPVGCGDAPDPELDVAAGTLRARSDDGFEAEVDPLRASGKVGGRAFGGYGLAGGKLLLPSAAIFGPDGALYVADRGGSRVQVYGRDGALLRTLGAGLLRNPGGLIVDDRGRLVVSDATGRLVLFDPPTGRPLGTLADGALKSPLGLAQDLEGRLHVADEIAGRIQVIDPRSGERLASYGQGFLRFPRAVAVDPRGQVWVGEPVQPRLQVFAGGRWLRAVDLSHQGRPHGALHLAMSPEGTLLVSAVANG